MMKNADNRLQIKETLMMSRQKLRSNIKLIINGTNFCEFIDLYKRLIDS